MKKTITLILALMLVLAVSVPALAANPSDGSTTVTYTVSDEYNITIPANVTISGTTATQTVGVSQGSVIPANKILEFKIAGAINYGGEPEGFRMKNNVGTNVYLGYTIEIEETPVVKGTAFLTATPVACYTGTTVTLTYTTAAPQSAGTYTDTLTFTVGLVDAP